MCYSHVSCITVMCRVLQSCVLCYSHVSCCRWAIKYAPDIGATHMQKGRPHFFTVRRTFRNAEVSAYLIGVLLAVGAVLMWPACMLLLQVFNRSQFRYVYSHTFVLFPIDVVANDGDVVARHG